MWSLLEREIKPEEVTLEPLPPDWDIIEAYKLYEASELEAAPPELNPFPTVKEYPTYRVFSKAVIAMNPIDGERRYFVIEEKMNKQEKEIYDLVVDILSSEIMAPDEIKDREKYLALEATRIAKKYKIKLKETVSWPKIIYYIKRNLLGYGPIDGLMRDPNIEDISCDGVGVPVYIWHRRYESMKTNIIFNSEEYLDEFIVKLVHRAGKHISTAFPIVDVMLEGKHRLAASYRREITPKGGTFTIRKFREKPYTIVDLINFGVLTSEMAAYLWMAMEYKKAILIIGATAAGKTTLLNALSCMIRPEAKIITVEETAELRLPHENWIEFISRPAYGLGVSKETGGGIELFDLVVTSLRHRPDYIIVGEIRGREAYALIQAIATGHGGLTTFHADSVEAAIKRFTQKPLDIAPAYIPLVKIAILLGRVNLPNGRMARRIKRVDEIIDDDGANLQKNTVFWWNAGRDLFIGDLTKSRVLKEIAIETARTIPDIINEIREREALIEEMIKRNVTDYREIGRMIREYYLRKIKTTIKM